MIRKRFEARDQCLIVRLTPKEKSQIRQTAKMQNLTASEYIRRLAEKPSNITLHDIRKSVIDCKYLTLSIRDDISAHLIDVEDPGLLNTNISAARAKLNSLETTLTDIAMRLSGNNP